MLSVTKKDLGSLEQFFRLLKRDPSAVLLQTASVLLLSLSGAQYLTSTETDSYIELSFSPLMKTKATVPTDVRAHVPSSQ